jgi:hypothetical protein
VNSTRTGFMIGLLATTGGLAALTSTTHAGLLPVVTPGPAPVVTRAEVQAYPAQDVPDSEVLAEPRVCGGKGVGVPERFDLPPGWSSEVVRDGVPGVEALALSSQGQLYMGGQADDARRRVVSRLDPDGILADSRTQAEPDALAVDGHGRIWLGSYDILKTLGPPEAGADQVRHKLQDGGNIDELAVTSRGERVWIAMRDGRVVEVVGEQDRSVVPYGQSVLLAVDGDDELWVVRGEAAGWWLYQLDGTTPREWQKLDDLIEDLVAVKQISWGPDGALYVLAQVLHQDPLVIVRWDPDAPRQATTWAGGLGDSRAHVGSMAWDDASQCLYLSSPDAGKIYRSCPCEDGLMGG